MHFASKVSLAALAIAVMPVSGAVAQTSVPAPATPAARVAAATDDSRISLAGTVVSTKPDSFLLDIGRHNVTVEMDDWDWFKEGKALKRGDRVVVSGRVDDDLWETKKIEASSVYVQNLGVTFYASGADEEDLASALVLVNPVTSASGTVTSVEGQEFTIGSANGPVRVDMTKLSVRPVLKVGDRVNAWGDLDVDAREKLELMAAGVAVLSRDTSKTSTANTNG